MINNHTITLWKISTTAPLWSPCRNPS